MPLTSSTLNRLHVWSSSQTNIDMISDLHCLGYEAELHTAMWHAFIMARAKTAFPVPSVPRFLCIVCHSNIELSLHNIINIPMWWIQPLAIRWGVGWTWLQTRKRSLPFWSGLHPLYTERIGCKKIMEEWEDFSGNREFIKNNYRWCLRKSWLHMQLFNCHGKNMPAWVGYWKTLSTLRCFKLEWVKSLTWQRL